jgi:hypothetical protein
VIGGGGSHAGLRQVTVSSPVDVCSFVEELGPDAVGELQLGANGASHGAVFVEQGRVCWAAARGLARRFTELLVAHTGASARTVEDVVVGCLADGSPFGERLVEASVVSPSQLRATLLQHAAESLHVACREPAFGTWCPRRQRGYASRFTFTAAEMLARTLAEENVDAARVGKALLEALLDRDDGGAVFVRRADRSTPQPVALAGVFRADARGLIRAGKWAASALDVAADNGAEPFIAASHEDITLVAWTSGALLMVATTTPLGAARLLRHARADLGRSIHGRV